MEIFRTFGPIVKGEKAILETPTGFRIGICQDGKHSRGGYPVNQAPWTHRLPQTGFLCQGLPVKILAGRFPAWRGILMPPIFAMLGISPSEFRNTLAE